MASETVVMRWLESAYSWVFRGVFRFRWGVLLSLGVLLGGAGWMLTRISKQGMPTVSRTELEVLIDWNEPLTVAENQRRLEQLLTKMPEKPRYVSAFVGQQQFLLNRTGLQQTENEALLSLQAGSERAYTLLSRELLRRIGVQFPAAVAEVRPANNVFEQLFTTTEPFLRLKLYNTRSAEAIPPDMAEHLSQQVRKQGVDCERIGYRQRLSVRLLPEKLLLYDVDEEVVVQALKTLFSNNQVTTLQYEQQQLPLLLIGGEQVNWRTSFVANRQKQPVLLRELIVVSPTVDYKALFADKEGVFVPLDMVSNVPKEITSIQKNNEVLATWSGRYFRDQHYLVELGWIVLVAVALLFCILTAQFESLQQPLIVMLIIVLGLAGAVWALYLAGDTLNVLSAIGMVVLIGLLDNDSILKIDTMNRGRATLSLLDAIRQAGLRRLKSQMMTYLTTVLGLLPILFSGGLGAELQRPLALSVIGGMTVGVLVSWTVIPLLYWFIENHKAQTR